MANEKQLIYLEDAIAKIVDTPSAIAERVFNGDYGYDQNPDVLVDRQREIIDLLMDVPTLEVVRCKDSKFFHDKGYCTKITGLTRIKPDDFCSRGEYNETDDADKEESYGV